MLKTKVSAAPFPESKPRLLADVLRFTGRLARIALRENPVALVFLILFSLAVSGYSYMWPKAQEWIVDVLSGNPTPVGSLRGALVAFGAVLLLGSLATIVVRFLTIVVFNRVREYLDVFLRGSLARLDVAHHEDPKFVDQIEKATTYGLGRSVEFLRGQVDILTATVTLGLAVFALAKQNWWLMLLVGLTTLPTILMQIKFAKDEWHFRTERVEQERYVGALRRLFGGLTHLVELKLFSFTGHLLRRFAEKIRVLRDSEIRYRRKRAGLNFAGDAISDVGLIAAMAYFAFQVAAGDITVGRLVFLFGMIILVQGTLKNLSGLLARSYEHVLFLRDLFAVTDAAPRVLPPVSPVALPADRTPEIRFENVSFAYPDTTKLVLQNVSFTIPPGQKFALIGLNGAGKTTLIKLLCRFYDPTEGCITVGGVDLREVDLETWYRHLGALFQDFTNYTSLTISEAIAIGDVTAHDAARVREAAEQAEAAEFIDELDKGYEQIVGKAFRDGVNLSGGQWQKLAIARVFYRNPRIWIMDEPTAAVDAQAEARIFDRIEALPDDRSAIVISHRFSTVRNADRILVLKDATISEQGTHEELMAAGGEYARLFTLQAGRYQAKEAGV